jgi:hypothetical protein
VTRVVTLAAIPAALIAVVGIVIATSHGNVSQIRQSALGDCVSASAPAPDTAVSGGAVSSSTVSGSTVSGSTVSGSTVSGGAVTAGSSVSGSPASGSTVSGGAVTSGGSAPAADGSAPATPCPSGSAPGGSTALASASPGSSAAVAGARTGTGTGRPDLAETGPVDPAGDPISLNQTTAQAANSLDCTLTAPASPLSAQGLATPWQLGDGCSEANPNEQAFVEATILEPHGQVRIYDPLVVTQGTTPAVTPTAPAIPRGSQVIINTGFNGNNLVLEGAGAAQGKCVDAYGNSIIAQTSACNAAAFFAAANAAVADDILTVPALGNASDGKACESTESFSVIDQDQSDNVISQYLLDSDGRTAQDSAANDSSANDSAANKSATGGATVITNGSDDALLGHFIDPALGCTPFTATDPTSPDGSDGSQALNSLSARLSQASPRALLPVNDPQLLVNGQFSIGKVNTYRAETDQPLLPASTNLTQNAAAYCQNMVSIAPARLKLDAAKEVSSPSPVPATGDNLATFMGARLSASFGNLNCQDYGLKDPVTVTTNAGGVATAVRYDIAQQRVAVPRGRPSRGTGGYNQRVPMGRRHHRENGAGM